MTEPFCPLCNEHIESIERVGEITYEQRPCGHHVDELMGEGLATVDDGNCESMS